MFLLALVKNVVPEDKELHKLAFEITYKWKDLGRRLHGYHEPTLHAIDEENKECSEKAYRMLRKWKKDKGSDATFRVLYDALCDTGLRWLAEMFCGKLLYPAEVLSYSLGLQSL